MFRRFLCAIGFHSYKTITISGIAYDMNTGKPEDLYYDVCKHCGEGHPMNTGEW